MKLLSATNLTLYISTPEQLRELLVFSNLHLIDAMDEMGTRLLTILSEHLLSVAARTMEAARFWPHCSHRPPVPAATP